MINSERENRPKRSTLVMERVSEIPRVLAEAIRQSNILPVIRRSVIVGDSSLERRIEPIDDDPGRHVIETPSPFSNQ